MKIVTDEISNPFGMKPPCLHTCTPETDRRAVFGYGDANADIHVIGDHPGVHGGLQSGVPFTGHPPVSQLLALLEAVDLLTITENRSLAPSNCFLSYRHCCCRPPNTDPTPQEYAEFDRFFDAELRAIAADVLIPIGERTSTHIIEEYTAKAHQIQLDMTALHATQIKGRGFLVFPLADPSTWTETDYQNAETELTALLSTDYHQLVDLGRFLPGGDPYFIR